MHGISIIENEKQFSGGVVGDGIGDLGVVMVSLVCTAPFVRDVSLFLAVVLILVGTAVPSCNSTTPLN